MQGKFCFAAEFLFRLGETVSLKFDFCPARVRMSTTLWRVAGCGNYVRESELHRSCKMRDCVSISAVLHFTGDRD